LELENEALKRNLSGTATFCDDYVADVNRGAAVIANLQSDIMTLLSNVPEYPQRPQDQHDSACDSTPFVVVLINGHENMLMEEDVMDGAEGGKKAARKFHNHLMEYLTRRKVFENDWKLIIKFYASMNKLGTTYIKSGIIDDIGTWRRFIGGFNEAYEFCYFIDAGDDQATAQGNVQDQLELFFDHEDCRHTVLVGASDGSYTGFLRQYSEADDVVGRFTLVEAIPSIGEFQELAGRFLPQGKEDLFGNEIDKHFTPPPTPTKPFDVSLEGIPTSLLPGPKSLPITPTRPPRSLHPFTPPASPVSCPINGPPYHHTIPLPQSPVESPIGRLSQPQYISPRRSPVKNGARRPLIHQASQWNQVQLVRPKPLASIQPRTPQARLLRPKHATFFNAQGQRIDPREYANMYTQRYLQC